MSEPLKSRDEALDTALAELRALRNKAVLQLRRKLAERQGAALTEQIDPARLGDEGHLGRLAGFSIADSPRAWVETMALLGGIGSGSLTVPTKEGAAGLAALEVSQRIGEATENIPVLGRVAAGAREGVRAEEESILGREGAGTGTKAAVLATEILADPFELLPGGLAAKGVRLAATGAGMATLAGVAASKTTRAGVRKAGQAVARKVVAEELTEAAGRGLTEGAVRGVAEQGVQQGQALTRARAAADKAAAEAFKAAQEQHVAEIARRSKQVAEEMLNFPFAPTAVQKGVKGQEAALAAALELERSRRRFSPILQTAGPEAGRKFLQRPGPPTTRPTSQIQSQLAREPVTGTVVGGGLPESFAARRVEGAVVPLSDARASRAMKRLSREMAEGPADVALRAQEVQKAAKAGKADGKILPDGNPLAETFDEATGKVIHPLRFQERLAALWHGDYAILKDKAIRRAEQRRVLVEQAAKSPEAVQTYRQAARRTGRSVDELIDGDLLGMVERTGNPMMGRDDTLEAVKARVSSVPVGAELEAEVVLHRRLGDRLLQQANDLNAKIGQKPVDYRENWIYHRWKSPSKIDLFFQGKAAKARAKGSPEFTRDWPTYFAGVHFGDAVPHTLRFSDNSLFGEMEYARALASKQALELLGKVNTAPDGRDAFIALGKHGPPKGYTKVENSDLRKLTGISGGIGVHDSVARVVRGLLAERDFNAFDKLLAWSKINNLGISTFHHFVLGLESAPALLGPIRGVRAAAKFRMGLPWISPSLRNSEDLARLGELLQADQLAGKVTGLPTVAAATELGREAMVRSFRFGVTGEPSSDILRAPWEELSRQLVKGAKKTPVVGKPLGKAAEIGVEIQAAINRGLWDGLHAPIKHYAFNVLYDGLLQVKRGNWTAANPIKGFQKKVLEKLSDEEIGYRAARVVNDEFGGQLWEGHVRGLTKHISGPEASKWLRRFMLSPDWLTSSVRMGLAAFDVRDPVRFISGFRHWKNFTLGTALYANLTNFVLARALRGEGKFIFDDPERRSLFHINTGLRDRKTGERIYARWGKQFQETLPFAKVVTGQGAGEAREVLERKITPILNAFNKIFVNPPEDFPTALQVAERRAASEGRELSTHEWGFWALVSLGKEGVLPFSFRETGVPFSPVAISKGINVGDAEMDLTDAIDEGNSEEVQRIIGALSTAENLRPEVIRNIYGRAQRNVMRRRGLVEEETEEQKTIRRRNIR